MAAASPPCLHASASAATETRVRFQGKEAAIHVTRDLSDDMCSVRLRGDLILSHGSRRFGPNGWFVDVADPVVKKLDLKAKVYDPNVFQVIEVCSPLIHRMLAEAPATSGCDLAAVNWVDSICTPRKIAEEIGRIVGGEIGEIFAVSASTVPMVRPVIPGYDLDIEMPQLWVSLVCTEHKELLLACKDPAAETVAARVSARRRKRRRGELCAICLLETEEEEEAVRLPCSHPFHSGCIMPWFHRSLTCPTCRRDIMQCFSLDEPFINGADEDERCLNNLTEYEQFIASEKEIEQFFVTTAVHD